tara:strand:- start:119 stop:1651 length:1533 start_codon:yes stop_codon:yes gene_type:complete
MNDLINTYQSKNYEKVMIICEEILKLYKDIPEVYNFYGLALQNLNRHKQAINYFNKAISIQPKDYSAFNNLAISYKFLYMNKLAYENFNKCLELKNNYFPALINFANLKKDMNEYKDAIDLFQEALKIKPNPNEVKILFSLSESYEQIGEIEKAKETIKKILVINSSNTAAHYVLSKYLNYKNETRHLKEMEIIFKDNSLEDQEISNLSFALGKAYEEKNIYEKSFNFYKKANESKRKSINYNINYFNNIKTNLINFFESFNLKKIKKYNKKKIIFICGMPRSGTTLVDQIISSHKKVISSGENSILPDIIENNILGKMELNPEKISDYIFSNGEKFNNYYYFRLNNINLDHEIITDKTVQNFIWIGFIRVLFPNSKIINCVRSSKETCFSIFKNNFHDKFMNWSYKQDEIVNFYNFYVSLIKFWDHKFPGEMYNIKYENVLSDPKNEIKKLINFCDLDWDENCLKFQKNKNPVNTASNLQVRKPLYNSSKNVSKNYANYLSNMFKLLES